MFKAHWRILAFVLPLACAAPAADDADGPAGSVEAPAASPDAALPDRGPQDTFAERTEGGIDSPPWQAARARGVDFRAVGQEPGWSLEVHREGRLVYAGDYGTDTLIARAPEPVHEGDALTWTVRADDRALRVRVIERTCQDTMSGERFSHAVTLFIDERELRGCGRWLGPQR